MSFADDVLAALEPMLYAEDETGNALTTYLTGLSTPFELIETWASDTDTDIGWSLLLDVDRCPVEALPWLAQIIGMQLDTSLSEADQRQQISDANNWVRGSLPAIQAAPAPYLTGTKTVIVRERYDGSVNDAPYYMEVVTYDSETPDPTKVLNAITAQKPVGIILTYAHLPGQDLQHVKDTYATLQDVKNRYVDLASMRVDF